MKRFYGLLFVLLCAALALPLAVTFDKDGNPSYTEWSSEQLDSLYQLFKNFDANKVGIDRAFLKQLNKGVGTNDLQKGLDGLMASGRLESKRVRPAGGAVAYETFFWKGV